MKPVVRPKSNRRWSWQYDKVLYKKRNQVERLFRRLKGFRRIFTRYDKLDVPVKGAVVSPVAKALIDGRPRSKSLGHIPPSRSRAQHPKDAIEHQSIVPARSPHFLLVRKNIRYQLPTFVRKFISFCHLAPWPCKGKILHQETFRTEPREVRMSIQIESHS